MTLSVSSGVLVLAMAGLFVYKGFNGM
jgi:hypothetical protein